MICASAVESLPQLTPAYTWPRFWLTNRTSRIRQASVNAILELGGFRVREVERGAMLPRFLVARPPSSGLHYSHTGTHGARGGSPSS